MGIDIRTAAAADIDDDRWDRLVHSSSQGTFFHQAAALELQAEHYGDATLHRLVGMKGQEPVGLFPVFEIQKGPITAVFSPTPDLWVPTMGPVLVNVDKLSQRKVESRLEGFIDGCLRYFHDEIGAQYVHVRTDDAFTDLRPFQWNDCDVVPQYTYVVDLERDRDELLGSFSRDARSNIRTGEEAGDRVTIAEEGAEGAALILDRVRARYEEQELPFNIPSQFGVDLYNELPEGQLRPYVCRVDGAFAGGIIAVDYGDTVFRWVGGAKPEGDVDLPINDLLDWHVMTDAMERGRTTYDLVGAGNPRTNSYKSKFGPELRAFATIDGGTRTGRLLVDLYRKRWVLKDLPSSVLSPESVPSILRGR